MTFVLLGILNAQAEAFVGEPAFDLLETTTLGTATSSVSFTGLGSYTDYKHLHVRYVARTDGAYNTFAIKLNSSQGVRTHELQGQTNKVQTLVRTDTRNNVIARSGDPADAFGAGIIDILDFSDTSKNTTMTLLSGNSSDRIEFNSSLYDFTAAITEIEFDNNIDSPDFLVGSRFSLYGIKAGA